MKSTSILANLYLSSLLFWALLASLGTGANAGRMSDDPDALNERYSVANFSNDNVIGFLGHPLGTVVRATGVVLDEKSVRRKSEEGKTLLEIRQVNGQKLDTPITFEFHRSAEGIEKPEAGTNFDYYVHEYGEFDGTVVPPAELGIKNDEIAHDGFHYRRFITIHKSH